MKRQTPFLKHLTSFTVANTTDKQIEVNLFAPDVNGLENQNVRDDLSSIKVDYKQIQNHVARKDELITTVRFQVLNPKHDRLLFQTEGNEVINSNNIHGMALRHMDVVTKGVNGMLNINPVINSDWKEEPSILKDFNFEFTASKNCYLKIKVPAYTAYQIDFLRDSTLYLTMMRDIAPLNMDVYNALRDGFVLFNKLSEIVPISIDNSLPSRNVWEIVKQKEQGIFKLLSNISKHTERNKTNSNIVLLYNAVKETRFLIKQLIEQTKKLIENDKAVINSSKQKDDAKGINKYIKAAQKKLEGTKSVNFFDFENDDSKNKSRKKKTTKNKPKYTLSTNVIGKHIIKKPTKKTNPESFDPLNTKIKSRMYKNHPTSITKPVPKKSVKKPIKKKGKK
jgi:hypothetical protein